MIYGLPIWNWFVFFFIYIPIVILWISVIIDIFSRHDLSGWNKFFWVLFVFILPFFGALIYLAARPPGAREIPA
ncbi:MAG: hypothetical protein C4562_04605 [Actinobacteria bacterium]|nr:MAG: hypothetical protein C4562_04605 [Actinomycetota bacterium]